MEFILIYLMIFKIVLKKELFINHMNIEFYYNSFVDWLTASDKRYKNYSSAFRNCCRQEWYKNTSGYYKEEEKKDNMILAGCSKGCYKRKIKPGVYAYCPECREQLVEI